MVTAELFVKLLMISRRIAYSPTAIVVDKGVSDDVRMANAEGCSRDSMDQENNQESRTLVMNGGSFVVGAWRWWFRLTAAKSLIFLVPRGEDETGGHCAIRRAESVVWRAANIEFLGFQMVLGQ